MIFKDSKKIRISIAFSKLLNILKWRFCHFHGIFWPIFACALCRLSIHTLIFLEIKVLWWSIYHVSFIYIWLVILEFPYFKCFCTSRKYQFRLLLGVFLDITSQKRGQIGLKFWPVMLCKVMRQILDSFYSILEKWSKMVQKSDFLAHF